VPTKITAAQFAKVVEHAERVLQGARRTLKTANPAQLAKELEYAELVLKGVRRTLTKGEGVAIPTRGKQAMFGLDPWFLPVGACKIGIDASGIGLPKGRKGKRDTP